MAPKTMQQGQTELKREADTVTLKILQKSTLRSVSNNQQSAVGRHRWEPYCGQQGPEDGGHFTQQAGSTFFSRHVNFLQDRPTSKVKDEL